MPESKSKTKLWRRVFTIFALVLVVALGAWFYANHIARQQIQTQLNALGVGEVRVGAVSIGPNGVTARNVAIFDDPQDTGSPRLVIDALKVHHPLSGLMSGDTVFEKVELAGVEVFVDVDQATFDSSMKLDDFSLPAKELIVTDSSVVMRQTNRTDFKIEQVELRAETVGNEIKATAQLGLMAGGIWTVKGAWDSSKKSWWIDGATDSARLVDGTWQLWPLMPDSMQQSIEGNAELAAKVNIKRDSTNLLMCQAEIEFSQSRFRIPTVDMPLEFEELKVVLDDNAVRYVDVLASTDGGDRLSGSGSTSLSNDPVVTSFDLEFSDLDVATLRKLAPAIPTPVSGKTTGIVKGTVSVESSLRTTLALRGRGHSTLASYGQIKSNDVTTTVEIQHLVIDGNFSQETLEGFVIVEAQAADLPANDIFQSLELTELSQQLQIEAAATGQFRLELPLATAENMATWKMDVTASASEGTISGQSVHDVDVRASLKTGNLHFDEVALATDSELVSKLKLKIDWPLTDQADHAQIGTLDVDGRQLAPPWVIAFIERQIANANGWEPLSSDTSLASSLPSLEGVLNFESQFEFPTDQPDSIENWNVRGAFSDAWVGVDGYQLRDLKSEVQFSDGLLSIENLNGVFDKGALVGNAKLNLMTGHVLEAKADGTAVPLRWLASVGAELSDDLSELLAETDVSKTSDGEQDNANLDGVLSLSFELKDKAKLDFNLNEADPLDTGQQNWVIATRVSSQQLRINDRQLENLLIEGEFDSREIRVQKGRADLPDRGWLKVAGNWFIEDGVGQADLDWRRLPIRWLATQDGSSPQWPTGTTTGNVKLSKKKADVGEGLLPVSVTGSITTNGLAVGGFKTRELGFDIRTVGDKLLMGDFRADDNLDGVNLEGKLSLAAPYAFEFSGDLNSLPVSRIFAMPSVTEKIGATKDVSGIANGTIQFGGNLQTYDVVTSGDIVINAPRVDGKRLGDIKAQWKHVDRDWTESTGIVRAFGGKIELKELSRAPSRIRVELSDLVAKELSAVANLPLQVSGALSGEATLSEWDSPDKRRANVRFEGASALVGAVEMSQIEGSAELKNQQLKYLLEGRLLDGKVSGRGETDLVSTDTNDPRDAEFPLEIQFANGSLNGFYKRYPSFSSLRPLLGSVSAKADLVFRRDSPPTGNGVLRINDLTWKNKRLTREVSTVVKLLEGNLQFENLRADLQRGEISGRASFPLVENSVGTYQLDIRQFDLPRFLGIVLSNPVEGFGFLDARISGRVGRSISGKGDMAINRSKFLGLSGRTFRVPVRFQFEPRQQSGRVEFRESRFQLFGGNVSGGATLEIGRTLNLLTDLRVSKLDTEKLFSSFAGIDDAGQGDLSGRLVLKGNSIRTMRDLKGSFTGKLVRAEAFQLPLLDSLATFIGGNGLQARDFESDGIELHLNGGKVEFRRLNLSNSLAKIAITGNAFVDGRLDLDVSARVERINQPTLIDQLAGSPLSRLSGSPVSVFAQAADFLSERLVFVKIGGTMRRPQVRADAGKQLQEETIRYFLRGSQILPNSDGRND